MKTKQYPKCITASIVLAIILMFMLVGCKVSVNIHGPGDSQGSGVVDYYTMVPYDYDIMPHRLSDGGLSTDYKLTFYSAEGQAKDMEFTLTTYQRNQVLCPPGTYMMVSTRGDQFGDRGAIDSSGVPDSAMSMIQENNIMPPTTSLSDYAKWRTEILNTMHGEWATVDCHTIGNSELFYSYVLNDTFSDYDPDDLTELVNSLDADYLVQYRSDYLLYPNLRLISLFIQTSDNVSLFYCEYNEYIKFAYED